MKFAIWGFQLSEEIQRTVHELIQYLKDHEHEVTVLDSFAATLGLVATDIRLSDGEDLSKDLDCILAIGGDGTLLSAAQAVMKQPIPILGINLGKLGFLSGMDRDWEQGLEHFIQGHYHVQERMVLTCKFQHSDGTAETFWALNEIVVERADRFNLLSLHVDVDDDYMNTYKADGLIISTPTGSTAYALSAGGPILDPGLDAILITPISAHTLSVRPVVIPSESVVHVKLVNPEGSASMHVDGRSTRTLRHADRIRVRMSTYRIQLVALHPQSFYGTLRKKLHWGRSYENGADSEKA